MSETVSPKYLTIKEARTLRTRMREDTKEGQALRKELIDIVTLWMNGEIFPIELAPTTAAILQLHRRQPVTKEYVSEMERTAHEILRLAAKWKSSHEDPKP
jgi:hypothetical protein